MHVQVRQATAYKNAGKMQTAKARCANGRHGKNANGMVKRVSKMPKTNKTKCKNKPILRLIYERVNERRTLDDKSVYRDTDNGRRNTALTLLHTRKEGVKSILRFCFYTACYGYRSSSRHRRCHAAAAVTGGCACAATNRSF